MSDGVALPPTGVTAWTDDLGATGHAQYVKLADGTDGSATRSKITTSAAGASDPGLVVRDAGQIATLGALTETAPANDTASSGLNGRLQRIAQNLTTLYTLFTTGYTPYHLRSAASNNATSLKASAGRVGWITASNTNATERWLKFYDKASAPTPGSDTVKQAFLIPGGSSGTNIPLPMMGMAFALGIAFAIVTGESNTDNTSVAAGEIHVNIGSL